MSKIKVEFIKTSQEADEYLHNKESLDKLADYIIYLYENNIQIDGCGCCEETIIDGVKYPLIGFFPDEKEGYIGTCGGIIDIKVTHE